MSQMPPPIAPPPPGYAPFPQSAPQQTNGPAIVSLICGILGCVPILTGLLAVIFGIIGIKKTRDPQVGGKALAIVGLVLGILSIAGWSVFGGAMYVAYAASQPARPVARQFAIDLTTGNTPAAVAASAGLTAVQLDSIAKDLKPWGTVTDTSFASFKTRANLNGSTTCDLGGTATFTTAGTKTYTVTLVKLNGAWKVQSFNFQ
jgi:hypothetical protein